MQVLKNIYEMKNRTTNAFELWFEISEDEIAHVLI